MNILFVCSANISRSYLAEQLFRHQADKAGISGLSVSSAGMVDFEGREADPRMVEYLLKQEIPAGVHRARGIQQEDIDRADRIYVMEKVHAANIEKISPQSLRKVDLLGNYLSPGVEGAEIMDPFGQSSYHYRSAISQISMAIKNLVQILQFEI